MQEDTPGGGGERERGNIRECTAGWEREKGNIRECTAGW